MFFEQRRKKSTPRPNFHFSFAEIFHPHLPPTNPRKYSQPSFPGWLELFVGILLLGHVDILPHFHYQFHSEPVVEDFPVMTPWFKQVRAFPWPLETILSNRNGKFFGFKASLSSLVTSALRYISVAILGVAGRWAWTALCCNLQDLSHQSENIPQRFKV